VDRLKAEGKRLFFRSKYHPQIAQISQIKANLNCVFYNLRRLEAPTFGHLRNLRTKGFSSALQPST
jgi:hypothetical protein